MIPLHGKAAYVDLTATLDRTVWLLVDGDTLTEQRRSRAFLVEDKQPPPAGFDLYVTKPGIRLSGNRQHQIELPNELAYLTSGDVLSLSRDGARVKVLWRHQGHPNSILLTERCDNYCLMCSQPPRQVDDDWLLDEARELIQLLPAETDGIILTGGEPTFYGRELVDLLKLCKTQLPNAAVHILSNGRRFADLDFAFAYSEIDNPQMMVGIPIYGTEPSLHDYVVQAKGAFNDTIRGILNLARLQQRIEIRVVLHKQTAPVIEEIAEFISRNLPFVDQVALMGLEVTGFTRANLPDLWIDPYDYKERLTAATLLLHRHRITTMIYNHQLCLLERQAWPFAVKSISDWKNEYHTQCNSCGVIDRCGGFFSSAKYKTSDHIHAITGEIEQVQTSV